MLHRSRALSALLSTGLVTSGLTAGLVVTAVASAGPAAASVDIQRGTVAQAPSTQTVSFADGVVYGIAQIGNKVFVGGSFTKVGPGIRGAAGVVDVANSTFGSTFPDIAGAVYTAVPDGSGGYYLGGDFTSVGGQARSDLAQVDASGNVTAWAPSANNPVRALAVGSDGVYVAGDFSTLNGSPAGFLGKVDSTGALVWNGNAVGGSVLSLALSGNGSTLYAGGAFTQLGGASTLKRFGAVSAATGLAAGGFAPGTVNQPVYSLAVQGSSVWLAGDFTMVNGTARQHLAQVDGSTGALSSMAVTVNGHVNQLLLDGTGANLFVAGTFSTVGALTRPNVASISTSTFAVGALTFPTLTGTVYGIALDGTTGLDVTGSFTLNPTKTSPSVLARVDLTTAAVTAVVPYWQTPKSLARAPRSGVSGGRVMVRTGGSLLVAGDFSDYGVTTRSYLAAYDLTTGALDLGFNPNVVGDHVQSIKASADGNSIFVGGQYNQIGGVTRNNLAKLSVTDGSVDPTFNPNPDSYIKDMAVKADGTALYVGGNFQNIAGQQSQFLAGLNPVTGAMLPDFTMPLSGPTNDNSEGGTRAIAISPDQTRLMVIGNFTQIAGQDRPLVAQIDISQHPAVVTSWRTNVYNQGCARGRVGWMRDVDISPDGTTAFIVSSGHIYYPACDSVNSFPMNASGPDVQPNWTVRIGDTIESVADTGDALYIGGHFRYMDTETLSQQRFHLAALDPTTGRALNWNPGGGGFLGVKVIEDQPAGIFVGGDMDAIGGFPHGRFGFFPAPTPGLVVRKLTATPWVIAPGQPVTFDIRVENGFGDRPVTVTGLSDSRLGDLNGQGTCAMPQTMAAGASYSCSVTDQTNAPALSDVTATTTATGDDGTTTYTGTDTSDIGSFASEPSFRLRLSSTPWTVTYPQGTVEYGASFLNIDTRNPITVTSLTSPQYGDLSSSCNLPITIQASRLTTCHLYLPVGGDVGAEPSFSFTATATTAAGTVKSNGSASITIEPPPSGTPLLYIVGNAAKLTNSEAAQVARLDPSYDVKVIDDDTVTPADTVDEGLVVVAGSVVPTKITALKSINSPVLVERNNALTTMGMADTNGQGNGNVTTASIVTPMHPLAVALNGTQTVNKTAKVGYWATPPSGSTSIQEVTPGQSLEFVYQPGATMFDGTPAPDCRIYFSGTNSSGFSKQELSLFDRAVAYGSSGCGGNMLWTAVGSSATAYPGDGRVSTAIGLNQPWGIAVNPVTNEVYIADQSNQRVLKVSAAGIVTTVAGTGTAGYNGDNIAATTARLSAPARVSFDAAGNLYIVDSGNNRIRKVAAATGIITTVAGNGTAGFAGDGGQATAARLKTPYDVFIASDGTMYIADKGNNRIRKVAPNGVISTFAGTGTAGYNGDEIAATSARLNNPYGVVADSSGNVYIADYENMRIRMVDPSGQIHTFAGSGQATANGDGGPADEAGIFHGAFMTLLPDGGMLISEVNNNRVRLVQDGIITTLAGTGQFGYVGDGGPPAFSTWQRPAATAVDAQGNIWVVDRNNHRIRVINAG